MPITRLTPNPDPEKETSIDVFHIQETIEVYDGALALSIDHLLNHIKVLVSMAYLPGTEDLEKALARHPVLRRTQKNAARAIQHANGQMPDRVVLKECQHLLESVFEIAHLAAWPETADQAELELDLLQSEVPFLDYRYDNDPFPSDQDREGK